jgi:hypothetical protein
MVSISHMTITLTKCCHRHRMYMWPSHRQSVRQRNSCI